MSTSPIDRGLHAVPAPPQRERLALLLQLKTIARRAFDTLVALPRGAAGWVLRQAQSVLRVLGRIPAVARVGSAARASAGLLQDLGPVTTVSAILTIPPVWRVATRATRWVLDRIAAVGMSVWSWSARMLGHFGPAGSRIATALESAGSAIASTATAVLDHPIAVTVGRGIRLLGSLIRPVTQSVLTHRLLARLIPLRGLRVLVEGLTGLALLIPGPLPQLVMHLATGPAAAATTELTVVGEGVEDAAPDQADAPVATETTADAHGAPEGPSPDADEPRNRAERRAQQQAHARARRSPKR